ncbi:hypothetical protein CAPTEDRAFT_129633 [Capitella teleta]|uniref:WD repeat-containing protein 60 n=1 Tax=Capitella teleta TaxID=283909 RepID=R7V1X1_CAPTE|nr:hypothetical protein CAPTEDRAFT_129633 [Capitella teleta]|eukprot:ELU09671.1 hypothetical protein CAPTEDRAFT_129633 [Capitella teleta]
MYGGWLFTGRHVVQSHFSSTQNQALITIHSAKEVEMNDPLARKGIVCVWNVNEPSQPQSLLACESQPTCGCLSPNKVSMAFAGMRDGSLVCWDLREANSMHRPVKVKDIEVTPRYPSYNTAGVLHYDNHQSSLVAVVTVTSGDGASTGVVLVHFHDRSEGLSFQLATLEENSVIFLWVVGEMSHPDLSGSESDLGLTPGSRIKLIKSSSVVLTSPLRLRTVVKSFDLNLLPSNNSHFYVATDTGCVMHGVRYGGKAPPKAYRTEMEEVIEVTSIDFSPFSEPVFLAGYRDGSLRLFHVDCDQPLVTWTHSTEGRSVQLVKWCRSRPAVFFVLDDQSSFHIWDLRMDDSCPIHSESIAQTRSAGRFSMSGCVFWFVLCRVTSLCLSNDFNATGLGMSGHKPQMVGRTIFVQSFVELIDCFRPCH